MDWTQTLSLIHSAPFYQLAALLALASVLGFCALRLRQPLVVAFIATGLIAGPGALNITAHGDPLLVTLSDLGVALLLFMVGLKLDLGLIRMLGPVALVTGAAQIILTTLAGAGLGLLLGFAPGAAAFIGLCLSFSSTIIVVKLLTDRRAIDSLYGRVTLGVLIVQDFAVIVAMVVMSGVSEGTGHLDLAALAGVFVRFAVLAAATGLFMRYAASHVAQRLAREPELMIIAAIGLAAGMAALCNQLGLSRELGGLLAGIALASTPQHHVIAARLAGLRDFLLLFFFIGLGTVLDIGRADDFLPAALALSAFVLLAKPLIVAGIMGAQHYRPRTGLLAGIALSQISEFSMIFATTGLAAGFIDNQVVGIMTLTGMITIALSTYGISYSERLLVRLSRALPRLAPHLAPEEAEENPALAPSYDVMVFGLGRYGLSMAIQLKESGLSVLGVDFDPQAVRQAAVAGIPAIYGDAADPAFPAALPLARTRLAVFAFQHYLTGPLHDDLRRMLAKNLRDHGFGGHIAATSHQRLEEDALRGAGIDTVLCPYEDAARGGSAAIGAILTRPGHGAPGAQTA